MSLCQPIRILIIENDAGQARLTQRTLEQVGYVVDHACDGDTGIAMQRVDSYDVLIIDHQMPGKNGIEVLRILNLWGTIPPTITVTGPGDEAVIVEALKLGAGDYLVKDIQSNYLTLLPIIVERLLAQRRLTSEKHQLEEQCRQLTERQRTEDALRKTEKMAALGTLSGGIAHEFNNMLTAILGFTQLAQSEVQADSKTASYLQCVFQAGSRAKDLVEQILAFSCPGTRAREALAVEQMIKEGLTLVRRSLPSTIEVRSHIAEAAGTVLANRAQFHQILVNLCSNAEYAMRETGGVLEIGVDIIEMDNGCTAHPPQLRPGPYVCLTVRDTGSGMPPDVVDRIFEPFFTTKNIGEGTGLGLAIVHGIVACYDGVITVQSALREGSLLTVYLPQMASGPITVAKLPESVTPKGAGRLLLTDGEGVLVCLGQA